MKDLRIAIVDPSISGKIIFFNLLLKKKEALKQTIEPVTYTRQAKAEKQKTKNKK
jgi:hypothetical protein